MIGYSFCFWRAAQVSVFLRLVLFVLVASRILIFDGIFLDEAFFRMSI